MPDYNKLCQYNVVIFNSIDNNQRDVSLLQETFERLNCRVKIYQHLTLAEYESAIQEICIENFSIYEYIVIVVLDNKNPYKHLITTSDGRVLRINNDLLVRITQNRTLLHKKRLFIIQTNQNYCSSPGPSKQHVNSETKQLIKLWTGPTVHLYGTSPGFLLEDWWSTPNAPVSPFIASFCKNFAKQADIENDDNSDDDDDNILTIQKIYGLMLDDLENEDWPVKGDAGDVYYGKALTANAIRDFFKT